MRFVLDAQLQKEHSALEFVVIVPKMDDVSAEWYFIVGNAECDLVERGFHYSSPWPAVGSGRQELPVNFQSLGKPRCDYFRPGTMPTQSSRGFPIAGNSDVPGTATRRLRKSNPPTNPGRVHSREFAPVLQAQESRPEAEWPSFGIARFFSDMRLSAHERSNSPRNL